jgi:hypothetical protein
MSNSKMVVIGVDPALKSRTHLFSDDEHRELKAEDVGDYFAEVARSHEDVLICWDAPLTGPHCPDNRLFKESDLSQRAIESFFRRKDWGFKPPKGISVGEYSGCPHWTISRHVFGLPRVGRWDAS